LACFFAQRSPVPSAEAGGHQIRGMPAIRPLKLDQEQTILRFAPAGWETNHGALEREEEAPCKIGSVGMVAGLAEPRGGGSCFLR
jgi:hypothetical protein